MLIRVMYSDGKFDMVKPRLLDDLIEQQKITSFKRTVGWVVVGRDTLRNMNQKDYRGAERRLS